MGGYEGLEVIDGYAYSNSVGTLHSEWTCWPRVHTIKIDMINSPSPISVSGGYFSETRFFGDLASNGENVFMVNSEMSDGPAWTIGSSYFVEVGSTVDLYRFDTKWDSIGVFGVDFLDTHLVAAGFKYGFSVLNVSNLSDIREVAYYVDTDSTMNFTHFALKENRLFAMGHWSEPGVGHWARLWMFELDDSVISGIEENPTLQTSLPKAFSISAYPNPFNSAVTIAIDIPVGDGSPVPISVEIYDVNGRRVKTVTEPVEVTAGFVVSSDINAKHPSTSSGSVFSPLTKGGQGGSYIWTPDESLPSGVYLVRARFDRLSDRGGRGDLDPTGRTATKRIVYLK